MKLLVPKQPPNWERPKPKHYSFKDWSSGYTTIQWSEDIEWRPLKDVSWSPLGEAIAILDAAEYDVAVAEFFYRFGVLDFKLNATVPEKRLLERLKLAWDIGRRALDASLSVTLHEASEILENAGSAPLGFEHDPALYELVREHCPGVDDAKERIVLLHAAREALPAERIWPMHFEWVGFEVVQYARDGFDLAFSECAENLRLAKKLAKCETCAHWFRVYREAQVYCSQPCRHKAYRERNLG